MATGIFLHLAQLCIKTYENYIYILRRFIEIGLIETNLPEIRLILNSSIEIRSIDHEARSGGGRNTRYEAGEKL